jgi:uncharacterized protein involved in type VI secretion and phage assembly
MEKGGLSEMVLIRRALEADFIFTADEYTDELRVLRFNNVEGISEPFRYNLKLAAQDPEIEYGTIVGKSACLTVYGETGERYFNGIVTRLIQGAIGSSFSVYHAIVGKASLSSVKGSSPDRAVWRDDFRDSDQE